MTNESVLSVVCVAGCLTCKNVNIAHYMQTFQPNFCIPAVLTGTIDFLSFVHSDLDVGWGSQGQRKAKPVGFIFLRLIRMKFGVVLKQFLFNILTLLLNAIYGNWKFSCVKKL